MTIATLQVILALLLLVSSFVTIANLSLYIQTVQLSKSNVVGVYKPVMKLNRFCGLVGWVFITCILMIVYNLSCLM